MSSQIFLHDKPPMKLIIIKKLILQLLTLATVNNSFSESWVRTWSRAHNTCKSAKIHQIAKKLIVNTLSMAYSDKHHESNFFHMHAKLCRVAYIKSLPSFIMNSCLYLSVKISTILWKITEHWKYLSLPSTGSPLKIYLQNNQNFQHFISLKK